MYLQRSCTACLAGLSKSVAVQKFKNEGLTRLLEHRFVDISQNAEQRVKRI